MSTILILFIFAAATYYFSFFRKSKKLEQCTWQELVDSIVYLGPDIQADLRSLQDNTGKRSIPEIFARLGGLSGLRNLEKNAEAMLGLAMYAERWDELNGPLFSELMRRDALKLKRAVQKLRLCWILTPAASLTAGLELSVSYGDLRQRLLAIYESVHLGHLPQLLDTI